MRFLSTSFAVSAVIFSSLSAAQVQECHGDSGTCYTLAISKSTNTLFFEMVAPLRMAWAGFGTGQVMAGSDMFIIYRDGDGNVTVSPRAASGHAMPESVDNVEVQILPGTGIQDDLMRAVFSVDADKIELDTSKDSSDWIAAWKSGSLSSSSVSAAIQQHDENTKFSLNLRRALLEDEQNPFSATNATSVSNSSRDGDSSDDEDEKSSAGSTKPGSLHVYLTGISLALLMPLASMLMGPTGF